MVRIEAEIPHDICVRCAGRIFALVDSGLTNTGRGGRCCSSPSGR